MPELRLFVFLDPFLLAFRLLGLALRYHIVPLALAYYR